MSISPLVRRYAKEILDFAIKKRLASMCEAIDFVEACGLASYSTNDTDIFRRAATYVVDF